MIMMIRLTMELQKLLYLSLFPPGHSSAASQVALKINKEAAGLPPVESYVFLYLWSDHMKSESDI